MKAGQGIGQHSWDNVDPVLVCDVCSICGAKRKKKTLYTKDMRMSKKTYVYFIDGKWEHSKSPCCIK